MDSINQSGGSAPGADDNASGVAVLDEVARAALSLGYRPDRTVIFYAYAAEEVGLVGSAEIAQAAEDEQLNVIGVLQLDMTNFNPNPNPYLAIITDYTDASLNQFARQLIDEYVGMPWKDTECGYACSDHASWQRRGFPVHYVHEATTDESNEDIHTSRDTLALSDGSAQHSLHFARYTAAFMAETAKGTIPECDANRPCAGGAVCMSGTCVAAIGGAGGAAGAGGMAGIAGVGVSTGGVSGSGGNDASAGGGGAAGVSGSAVGGASVGAGVPVPGGAAGQGTPALSPVSSTNDPLSCSCRAPAPSHSSSVRSLGLLLLASLLIAARTRSAMARCTRTLPKSASLS
jgi:leucyl aminopeptidase